jgi:hypothetical protein
VWVISGLDECEECLFHQEGFCFMDLITYRIMSGLEESNKIKMK